MMSAVLKGPMAGGAAAHYQKYVAFLAAGGIMVVAYVSTYSSSDVTYHESHENG